METRKFGSTSLLPSDQLFAFFLETFVELSDWALLDLCDAYC